MSSFLSKLADDLYQRVIVSYRSTLIGIGLAVAVELVEFTTSYLNALPANWAHVIASVLVILGGLLRSKQAIKIVPPAAILLALALALPARADFGVLCLSGCAKAAPHAMRAEGDVKLASAIWLGPSIGVLPFAYSTESKSWSQQLAPALVYGLKWRPPNWTTTSSLISLDLFASADFGNLSHIDTVPTLTFLDAISIGFGPRFRFATSDQPGSVSGVLAIGFSRSFGGP